jgi:hypothetical protein
MAPQKKKAPADPQNNQPPPHNTLGDQPILKQTKDPEQEAEDTEASRVQFDELTVAAIKLKAREKQLATKQRALDQANKLAEAKRKLMAMQEEVANLQKAYEETPGGSSQQQENHSFRQTNHLHYDE